MQVKARIIGLGSYLPEKILSNQDLEKLVETSDEWIVSRTGMKERRLAHADEFPSDMGFKAAVQALANAQIESNEVEMILVATMSPDYLSPSTANLIQAKLQTRHAASMDIQAACTGFLYALSVAKAFIESGTYKNVLVVATEKMSAFVDYQDRNTCILFGDGAAAAVVSNQGTGLEIETMSLGSDGMYADLFKIPAGGSRQPASLETLDARGHYVKMEGKELFKQAVRQMASAVNACLLQTQLTESEMSWLVPHQANKRIIDALAKYLRLPIEKVYQTIHKYGNTSGSSIVIALHELMQENTVKEGDHLLLTAFGGGLTWGAAVLTYRK